MSLLADWSIYVLVVTAVTGFVLQQSALKTGVLAPAMASGNAVSLLAGSSWVRSSTARGWAMATATWSLPSSVWP